MRTREEAEADVLLFEAAVAEAGYSNLRTLPMQEVSGDWYVRFLMSMPPEVAYKAGALLAMRRDRRYPCWNCWVPSHGLDRDEVHRCLAGNCPHEQVSA